MAEVIELGRHEASVESITTRLQRHADQIAHITCVVEYTDGTGDIIHDAKTVEQLVCDSRRLCLYADGWLAESIVD